MFLRPFRECFGAGVRLSKCTNNLYLAYKDPISAQGTPKQQASKQNTAFCVGAHDFSSARRAGLGAGRGGVRSRPRFHQHYRMFSGMAPRLAAVFAEWIFYCVTRCPPWLRDREVRTFRPSCTAAIYTAFIVIPPSNLTPFLYVYNNNFTDFEEKHQGSILLEVNEPGLMSYTILLKSE